MFNWKSVSELKCDAEIKIKNMLAFLENRNKYLDKYKEDSSSNNKIVLFKGMK